MPDSLCAAPYAWGMMPGRDMAARDKEALASFRYEHYFKSLPTSVGADHERRRVWSPHDEDSAQLTARNSRGDLLAVGTGTSAAGRNLPEYWSGLYRFDRLAALGLDKALVFSRLVEHPACRGGGLFLEFFKHCAASFTASGYEHTIHYCAPGLVSLYERLGYRLYARGRMLEGGLFRVPMILSATDQAYLRKAHPAFLQAAGAHLPPGNPGPLLAALPELAEYPLCVREPLDRLERVRSLLADTAGDPQKLVPDEAASALRKACLLHLHAGDQVPPSHEGPDANTPQDRDEAIDPPRFWFLLSGAWRVGGTNESGHDPGLGVFVNGAACGGLACLQDGAAVLLGACPPAGSDSRAVLPATHWKEVRER